ncbi:DUF6183 family protein [Streptomyces bambusae]|uniref:DUF6183 family protein n=1 Tax=Streptomyces bambusae TaxID=1550616 RepID=UPI001CFFA338|nr:DUF6183 family protein [Streptomyces bambusae]MCB5169709.1 DUF6183 family protein [Streptomyces bambusae]
MKDEVRELEALVWGQVEQRARQGDMVYVRELGARLAVGLSDASEQVRAYGRSLAHVVRALALTPGRDSVEQLIALLDAHAPLSTTEAGPRMVASLLAEAQDPGDLAELLYDRPERDKHDELRSCLFQELLLRGVDTTAHAALSTWVRWRPGWHPLVWLPAELRPFEAGSPFPSRGITSAAGGLWSGLTAEGRVDPATPRTAGPSSLRNGIGVELHETIVSATKDLGHCDAWLFEPDEPVAPSDVPALLPTLAMDCVAGLGPSDRYEVAIRPLADIWKILFSSASMGGVYGGGSQGAYGRRAAWFSLAGLVGAPAGASAAEVEALAMASTWFHFECDSEWFQNEIYDYGIAALSPGRRRIAVLAATDTD